MGEGAVGHGRAHVAHRRRRANSPTRIALSKSQPGVMDEGWTEWLFDTFGVKYTLITPTDLRGGQSRRRKFDVIVVGSQGIGGRRRTAEVAAVAAAVAEDAAARRRTARRRTSSARSTNSCAAAEPSSRGIRARTSIISALQLPVRNVVAGLRRKEYFTGRSIMQVHHRSDASGDGGHAGARRRDGVQQPRCSRRSTDSTAPCSRSFRADVTPLRSGFSERPPHIQGYAAALDVKHDHGHVVLFAIPA